MGRLFLFGDGSCYAMLCIRIDGRTGDFYYWWMNLDLYVYECMRTYSYRGRGGSVCIFVYFGGGSDGRAVSDLYYRLSSWNSRGCEEGWL